MEDRKHFEEIITNIREILHAIGSNSNGLLAREIYLHLKTKGISATEPEVKAAIRIMMAHGVLEKRVNLKRKQGYYYHLKGNGLTQLPLFDSQTNREDVERETRRDLDLWQADETEREQYTASVMEDIAQGHAQEESFAAQVKNFASDFAEENPMNLIVEMAEWVVDDLNSLAKRINKAKTDQPEQIHRLTRELGFRCAKATSFFQRLWRLDKSIKSVPGILHIPTVPQLINGHIKAKIDRQSALERLRERIYGEKVIEIIRIPENKHRAAIGTDASVADILVDHSRGSFIRPTPAVLFVAAGAMRVIDKTNMLNYWDYDLDPRELSQYRDLDAAIEGLLISPQLRREVITDFRHLRSAAMELRQYVEENRVVQRKSRWHPISGVPELNLPPEVTLLVRDGRIFPLVHRLDDYDGASAPDDILYGEVVRREIKAFQSVFHNTAGNGQLGSIYGGAVKAPEYSWLSMITFWYLYAKKGVKELADAFYRPPLNDQAVSHLLFWGLGAAQKTILTEERNMFVTFRALRKFADIAFVNHPLPLDGRDNSDQNIVDESKVEDWMAFIAEHIEDANTRYDSHKRGIGALDTVDEYRPFIDLCHRAGVLMFYGAPARMYKSTVNDGSHFFTPRWELAVDVTRSTNHLEQLKLFASWIVDKDGLVPDESHAVGGFEEAAEGVPLFIPNIVMEAHKAVSYGQGRHGLDVVDSLQKLVGDIRAGRLTQ
jgi:hypothetical protein